MKKILVMFFLTIFIFLLVPKINADEIPTITGPEIIFKQADAILTKNQIIKYYKSNVGSCYISSDGYTGNGATKGEYGMTVSVNYGDNETIDKDIIISVKNVLGNVVMIADYMTIYIAKNQFHNLESLIIVLSNAGNYKVDETTRYVKILDEYADSNNALGTYEIAFRLYDNKGLDNTYNATVIILDADMDAGGNLIAAEPSFWSKASKTITSIAVFAIIGLVIFIIIKKKK